MSNLEFVHNFAKELSYQGDMFFTSGDIRQDAKLIRETIRQQGYWAGTRVRYYFDKDFNLVTTEPREFGNGVGDA